MNVLNLNYKKLTLREIVKQDFNMVTLRNKFRKADFDNYLIINNKIINVNDPQISFDNLNTEFLVKAFYNVKLSSIRQDNTKSIYFPWRNAHFNDFFKEGVNETAFLADYLDQKNDTHYKQVLCLISYNSIILIDDYEYDDYEAIEEFDLDVDDVSYLEFNHTPGSLCEYEYPHWKFKNVTFVDLNIQEV